MILMPGSTEPVGTGDVLETLKYNLRSTAEQLNTIGDVLSHEANPARAAEEFQALGQRMQELGQAYAAYNTALVGPPSTEG